MKFGKVATNLCEAAALGRLTCPIARDAELKALLDAIHSGNSKRFVVAGPPGVGKTALIHGLALLFQREGHPETLFEVHPAALAANTVMVRDQMDALREHVRAHPASWVVIDELSVLVSGGVVLNELQKSLIADIASGDFHAIVAARSELLHQLERDQHPLLNDATIVEVSPLDAEATGNILRQIKPALEEECGTLISDQAVDETVSLSQQYQPQEALPGTAVQLLGRAGRRHRKKRELDESPPPWMDKSTMKRLGKAVGPHDILRVLDEITGFDISAIENEGWKQEICRGLLAAIPASEAGVRRLAAAVALVRQSMTTHGAAFATILVAGPPGTRKTHAAQLLAQSLPGDAAGTRLVDLSALPNAADLARLLAETHANAESPAPPAKPLAVQVFKSLHKAPSDVRLALGHALTTTDPAAAFPWSRNYKRLLNLVTFDATDSFAVSVDIVHRAERLLGVERGRLRAEAVYFGMNRAPSATRG